MAALGRYVDLCIATQSRLIVAFGRGIIRYLITLPPSHVTALSLVMARILWGPRYQAMDAYAFFE